MKGGEMKLHEDKSGRRCWYDTHLRLWTMIEPDRRDADGYLIESGETTYTVDRKEAMTWLRGGDAAVFAKRP